MISAADIAFIMSSSTSAWLLSPLECFPQKQNGWTLRFCFWGWIMWKVYNKTIIEFGFRMISWIIKTSCLCYLPKPKESTLLHRSSQFFFHLFPWTLLLAWLVFNVSFLSILIGVEKSIIRFTTLSENCWGDDFTEPFLDISLSTVSKQITTIGSCLIYLFNFTFSPNPVFSLLSSC